MSAPPKLDIVPSLVKREVDFEEPATQAGSLKLSVSPGTIAPALPARLVMIFDMSGSMRGQPMRLLEDALNHVYTKLRPQDKMTMIRFGGHATVDFTEWDKATIDSTGIEPFTMIDGGTNYDAAIGESLTQIRSLPGATDPKTTHSVSKQVLFLTDGHPYPSGTASSAMDLVSEHPDLGYTFNAMGLGDEHSVDKHLLTTYTEIGRGQFFNANDPTALSEKLDKLVRLSQNIVYAAPVLTMEVFPGVEVRDVTVSVKGMSILDHAGPGVHELHLPDIEEGSPIEINYEVHVADPKPEGTKQDIIQWSIPGQPPVVDFLLWVNAGTVRLAPANTRPTVLATIANTATALKAGDTDTALKLAETLTVIGTTLGDPTATGVGDAITRLPSMEEIDIGEILETITSTKTNADGTIG